MTKTLYNSGIYHGFTEQYFLIALIGIRCISHDYHYPGVLEPILLTLGAQLTPDTCPSLGLSCQFWSL